jgi:uncharacterized protein (TIGR03083 family)
MNELAPIYERARLRITDLMAGADAGVPVPCCPGWSAHDVLAHLVCSTEDVLAGRLGGPPTEEQTAEQVRRSSARPVAELLDTWAANAGPFEELIDTFEVWPAIGDALAHEHDVRGALGRPGAREIEDVRTVADRVLSMLQPPVPLIVRLGSEDRRLGPPGDDPIVLTTTAWDTIRWRMGRRSRAQLAAMAWSRDPGPLLGELVLFGPSEVDIVE